MPEEWNTSTSYLGPILSKTQLSLVYQPLSSPQIRCSTEIFIQGGAGSQPAYPGIGNPRLGVFEGRQEPHGQVVGHVQQLVVVVLDGHVAEGLLGVRDYPVGGQEAAQDPGDRRDTDTAASCWL